MSLAHLSMSVGMFNMIRTIRSVENTSEIIMKSIIRCVHVCVVFSRSNTTLQVNTHMMPPKVSPRYYTDQHLMYLFSHYTPKYPHV